MNLIIGAIFVILALPFGYMLAEFTSKYVISRWTAYTLIAAYGLLDLIILINL